MDLNLNEFRYVDPHRKSLSISDVIITPNKVNLSSITFSDLGYPQYVNVLLHQDCAMLAIQRADEPTDISVPFFTDDVCEKLRKNSGRHIPIENPLLARIIRQKLGWAGSKTMKAPGAKFFEEQIVLFNLKEARPSREYTKKVATVDDVLESFPKYGENLKSFVPFQLALPAVTSKSHTILDTNIVDVEFEEVI